MKPIKKIFSIFFLSGCLAAGWEYLAAAQDIGAGITDFSIEQIPSLNLTSPETERQSDLFTPKPQQKKRRDCQFAFCLECSDQCGGF